MILEHDGAGIEADIESLGRARLDEHGLGDAPDGISIWEGRLDSYRCGNPMDGEDWECILEGEFRDLTDQEWELLKLTGVPWELDPAGKPCGRSECGVSTGIHEGLTFGLGTLDDHGYWSTPCPACARDWEARHPQDGPAWPFRRPEVSQPAAKSP